MLRTLYERDYNTRTWIYIILYIYTRTICVYYNAPSTCITYHPPPPRARGAETLVGVVMLTCRGQWRQRDCFPCRRHVGISAHRSPRYKIVFDPFVGHVDRVRTAPVVLAHRKKPTSTACYFFFVFFPPQLLRLRLRPTTDCCTQPNSICCGPGVRSARRKDASLNKRTVIRGGK